MTEKLWRYLLGLAKPGLDDRLIHLVVAAWIQKTWLYLLGLARPGPAGRLMRLVGSALVQKMSLYLLGLAQLGGVGPAGAHEMIIPLGPWGWY